MIFVLEDIEMLKGTLMKYIYLKIEAMNNKYKERSINTR